MTAKQTILIVDDNPDDIEMTKIALAEKGREEKLETVTRGKLALDRLRSGNALPALILLDLKMPGMDGIATLRLIRADKQLKHIPVIVVTTSSLPSDEQDAYEAGADCFLPKAIDIEQFGSNLDTLCNGFFNSGKMFDPAQGSLLPRRVEATKKGSNDIFHSRKAGARSDHPSDENSSTPGSREGTARPVRHPQGQ